MLKTEPFNQITQFVEGGSFSVKINEQIWLKCSVFFILELAGQTVKENSL